LKNLTIENLARDFEIINFDYQKSILASYLEFLRFFKTKRTIGYNDFIVSSHMVYAWMPTMLRFDDSKVTEIIRVLNHIRVGELASHEELDLIKKSMNNSMVGPSKLLHFIRPDLYAIWDSRIYRYIHGHINQNEISKSKNYISYMDTLRSVVRHPMFIPIKNTVRDEFKQELSSLRIAEMIMFEADKLTGEIIT